MKIIPSKTLGVFSQLNAMLIESEYPNEPEMIITNIILVLILGGITWHLYTEEMTTLCVIIGALTILAALPLVFVIWAKITRRTGRA